MDEKKINVKNLVFDPVFLIRNFFYQGKPKLRLKMKIYVYWYVGDRIITYGTRYNFSVILGINTFKF